MAWPRTLKSTVGVLVCILAVLSIYGRDTGVSTAPLVMPVLRAVVPGADAKFVTINFSDLRVGTMADGKALFERKLADIEALALAQGIVLPAPESRNYNIYATGEASAPYSLGGGLVYKFPDAASAETFAKLLSGNHYIVEVNDARWGRCG